MNLKPVIYAALAVVFAAGCHNHEAHEEHEHEHEGHEHAEAADSHGHSHPNAVKFTHHMAEHCDFALAPATMQPLGQVIETMGRIESSQGDVATLTARTAGTVSFSSGSLVTGSQVAAGQTLFRVDASGLADNNLRVRHIEAKSEAERAEKEYERQQALMRDRLTTESELQRARADYEKARAAYQALSAGFAGGVSGVSSPIAGYLTDIAVTNGQYVEAGQTLATVARTRDLFIRAEVQPAYFPLLSAIHGAVITTPSGEEKSLAELGGAFVSSGRAVDARNPLIPVTFRIRNTGAYLPGAFLKMRIIAGPEESVLTVPSSSLIEEMGNYFVYIQLHPELYEKRQVSIGRSDGLSTQITSGLSQGDTIVSRGATLVKLIQTSGSVDPHSGHAH